MKLDSSISAVVTGGASGLGEATVRALVAQGVKVAIFDLDRQADRGAALEKELGVTFCAVNVTSDADVDAGFQDFADKWNPILDEFDRVGVKFALEVHPTEIAYDIYTAKRALEAAAKDFNAAIYEARPQDRLN